MSQPCSGFMIPAECEISAHSEKFSGEFDQRANPNTYTQKKKKEKEKGVADRGVGGVLGGGMLGKHTWRGKLTKKMKPRKSSKSQFHMTISMIKQ